MAEYIEREAIEKAVLTKQERERQHWIEYLNRFRATADYSSKEQAVDNWLRGYGEAVENLLAIFETIPATDVVEVKHGEWLYWQPGGTNHLWKCSVCDGAIVTPMRFVAKHIAFCEHCGADMRKEGADNDS